MSTFEKKLETGLIGEGHIAKWLIGRGFNVLPAYQVEIGSGKGPRLFTAEKELITPDMLAFNNEKTFWFEAKTKSAFTWFRKTNCFQTGIDLRHWHDYLEVANKTPWEVWILFLHKSGCMAKDTPPGLISPSGLYGEEIFALEEKADHESGLYGSGGMIYWREESLKKIATVEDLIPNY